MIGRIRGPGWLWLADISLDPSPIRVGRRILVHWITADQLGY